MKCSEGFCHLNSLIKLLKKKPLYLCSAVYRLRQLDWSTSKLISLPFCEASCRFLLSARMHIHSPQISNSPAKIIIKGWIIAETFTFVRPCTLICQQLRSDLFLAKTHHWISYFSLYFQFVLLLPIIMSQFKSSTQYFFLHGL